MLHWQLISPTRSDKPDLKNPSDRISQEFQMPEGTVSFDWSCWNSGKALGMQCLTIDTQAMRTVILPIRGMGIWKTWVQGIEFGWQSPVAGPVHPALVPVADPSGIGWLEGFDELLVRCGLLSNGAPDFDSHGNVIYPVHGRIANLPASQLRIEIDPQEGTLDVIGTVIESRFLVYALELQTRMRFRAGSSTIEIHDTVTNTRSTQGSMQLLYHINLGKSNFGKNIDGENIEGQGPLGAGSKIFAPLKRLAPRDSRAAQGIDGWDRCDGPKSGYSEQVYYAEALGSEDHWTEAMLCNADESIGYSVLFDPSTLPSVNFWKNTGAIQDGYVVGIEPATGFPNTKTFEEQHRRTVQLQGGESQSFRLKLQPHVTKSQVALAKSRIESLQTQTCLIEKHPAPGWSPEAS